MSENSTSSQVAEVAIIGAGPSGLAAATRLAKAGLKPVVFDLNAAPGGQVYRQVESPQADLRVTGIDYRLGQRVVEAFRRARVDYRPDSRVWWVQRVDAGFELGVLHEGRSAVWRARRLILCHGAMERPFPFPGWQLPGVMTAGAAQVLLKQGGLLPEDAPILVGSGPLIYLLGWQYLQAGRPPTCILDLTPRHQWRLPLRQPVKAWHARGYLFKGLKMMLALKRAGVAIERDIDALEAIGDKVLEQIRYRQRGHWKQRPASLLLSHVGVVPETHLTRSLGLTHRWHAEQQSFLPVRDDTLSADENLWVVGDGAAIGGAANAMREGTLSALEVIASHHGLTKEERDERDGLRRERARDLCARQLLDAMFLPPLNIDAMPEETIICRCEALTRGDLDQAISDGAEGPNQLKAFTRCGMGPCQGRQCSLNATLLLSRRLAQTPDQIGQWQIRPPVQTITLGELATSSMVENRAT
ncbi:MAG: NAD(P)/FAD-dependent oxidoreductase [Pseudomonadota bacterium]|nr:NAD(P)/FAD-dependent oxidoreductase [Pseudomonadota bacterium]